MALFVNKGSSAAGRGVAGGVPGFKRGGTKRGDGPARLHKNENIMPPKRKRKARMKGRRGGR